MKRVLRAASIFACMLGACMNGPEPRSWLRDDETCPGAFERGNRACYDMDRPPDGDEPLSAGFWEGWESALRNMGRPRCDGVTQRPAIPVFTEGELTVSLRTGSYPGSRYAPANCGAVWIESVPVEQWTDDPVLQAGPALEARERGIESGEFVRTLEMWAAERVMNLMLWLASQCGTENIDGISSATLPDHARPHELVWDGKDILGHTVPDGEYVLWVEITEDEISPISKRHRFIFQKGPFATTRTVNALAGIDTLTFGFTPVGAAPAQPAIPAE